VNGYEHLTHRVLASRLLNTGWTICGAGDWAMVWRSPDGTQAARVCPFELAYETYVVLCRNLAGNVLLPRIDLDTPLVGGGRLTVMEFLRPADDAQDLMKRWKAAEPSDPVSAIRREAERLLSSSQAPYLDVDLNEGNVMIDLAGQVKLVDLFGTAGAKLYADLLDQPTEFAAKVPASRRQFLTEIAYAQRNWTPDELATYRDAAAALP
jgi:hypothetical protein